MRIVGVLCGILILGGCSPAVSGRAVLVESQDSTVVVASEVQVGGGGAATEGSVEDIVAVVAAPLHSTAITLTSNNSDYKDLILKAKEDDVSYESEGTADIKMAITSHHLPVASDFIGKMYSTLRADDPDRKIFVVIGPDHPEKCTENVTVGRVNYDTSFGTLLVNEEIVDSLVSAGINEESVCLRKEHSIGVQADYIKAYFPEAKIVPITLSASTFDYEIERILAGLKPHLDEVTVVVSVDFNHFRIATRADAYDVSTVDYINALDGDDLTVDNVDSPSSLRTSFLLAKYLGRTSHILEKINSYNLIGDFENTTSYMNVVF